MRHFIAAGILTTSAALPALTAIHAGTAAHVVDGGSSPNRISCCVPH
jgi:hypothetical protein